MLHILKQWLRQALVHRVTQSLLNSFNSFCISPNFNRFKMIPNADKKNTIKTKILNNASSVSRTPFYFIFFMHKHIIPKQHQDVKKSKINPHPTKDYSFFTFHYSLNSHCPALTLTELIITQIALSLLNFSLKFWESYL